jgi:hypothetical protein
MARLIRLTATWSADPIYVNANLIQYVHSSELGQSTIVFGAKDNIKVKESPDQIISMLNDGLLAVGSGPNRPTQEP